VIIFRISLNEQQSYSVTTIVTGQENIAYSLGIAYDWIHNLIYWSNFSVQKISVAFGNGSHPATIISIPELSPHSIAIHPGKG